MGTARLSALDAALLSIETPEQQLNVLAVLIIDPDPAIKPGEHYQVARDRVAERLPLVPPLCRRLRMLPGLALPVWEDEADLAVDAHIHQVILDPPADLQALGKAAGAIAGRPMRRDRPLWEMWFVEHLEGGRTAVICKVHHSVIDGTSGFGTLAGFFDLEPHAAPLDLPRHVPEPPLDTAARVEETIVGGARWAGSFLRSVPQIGTVVARSLSSVGRADLALPLTAPRLAWNRHLPSARRAVEFTSVELSRLKQLRRAYGSTLNDLFTAVCTGVLRLYLADRGELPNRSLVAAVPVSERELDDAPGGNRFSSMFYGLPVHIDDPVARVEATKRSAEVAKQFYEQNGRQLLSTLAGAVPPRVAEAGMQLVSGLRLADYVPPVANVLISNVRGTEFPLWIAGGRVTEMFPMGPLIEGVGLNITVVSYLDQVGFGFLSCPDLEPDLPALVGYVSAAVAELEKAAPDPD